MVCRIANANCTSTSTSFQYSNFCRSKYTCTHNLFCNKLKQIYIFDVVRAFWICLTISWSSRQDTQSWFSWFLGKQDPWNSWILDFQDSLEIQESWKPWSLVFKSSLNPWHPRCSCYSRRLDIQELMNFKVFLLSVSFDTHGLRRVSNISASLTRTGFHEFLNFKTCFDSLLFIHSCFSWLSAAWHPRIAHLAHFSLPCGQLSSGATTWCCIMFGIDAFPWAGIAVGTM